MADPLTTLHYASNSNFVNGTYAPGSDGFNLADVTPSDVSSLPAGVKGLVWVGDSIGGATASFQATISSLIGNPNVYGFYLADEPAPGNAANLKAESDYIHTHDPGAQTFIVLLNNGSDTSPQFSYSPANTNIDLFGLDPYPVQTRGVNYSYIDAAVAAAEAQGIPQSQIVPVYQAFGALSPWVTPTVAQEQSILFTWGSLVPTPVFDYAYSWGVQNGDTALVTDPALQQVFAAHNGASSGSAGVLAGKVQVSSATEATALPGSTTIATFTDANTADTAAGFTASIKWGDGTTSPGTVSGSNGSFSVSGGHTYADEGSFPLSAMITRTADNTTITPTGTVVAAEADVLTPHAATITGTAGQALSNVTVATFTDTNTANVAGDFVASINWSDGTTSASTVSGANGTFTVTGSHNYAAAGTDTVAVTLTDDAPGTATATASSTAQVGSAAGTLAGRVQVSSATEATALPSSTTIATFTDTNAADTASGFTASIKWGDGTTSPGTVSGSNGSFSVSGGHTYADEGSFPLSATITSTADNTTITPTGTVVAAEADVLTPHAATITGTAGQALSNVTVATFTDTNTANVAGDFVASINWSDGTTSAGTVSGANGTFTVTGSHNYAAAGTDTVAVTLTDDAPGTTATATANSTAQISSGSSGRTISSAIVGPIVMAEADTPLTVTSSGAVSSTGNNVDGIDSSPVTPTTVTNFGRIYATGGGNSAGVWLQAGGSVNNGSGAVISGGGYGVDVHGGSGTVTNSGTISGGNYAVLFDNSGTNRLVVNPAAVFNGLVQGGSGANTLELAGGAGTISGLSNGSGTVAENGGWSFNNFRTVSVDTGGTWVLNGGDVPTIANDGTIAVSGSLDVSSAIDLSSTGIFQLAGGSVLEVAAALGAQSKMQFLESSTLVIDSAGSFGVNVGTTSYTGPQLQHFTAGDTIDLKNFALAGATLDYNTSTGLLQLHNGISQAASLAFQSSSVGSGTFHFVSDGATGILITHA